MGDVNLNIACPSVAAIENCDSCWNPLVECFECADGWWWKNYDTCLGK